MGRAFHIGSRYLGRYTIRAVAAFVVLAGAALQAADFPGAQWPKAAPGTVPSFDIVAARAGFRTLAQRRGGAPSPLQEAEPASTEHYDVLKPFFEPIALAVRANVTFDRSNPRLNGRGRSSCATGPT